MPAEWEPHEATWLAWPHERSDWPGKFAPVPWVYGEMVRYLSRNEKVRILIADAKAERAARLLLDKCGATMDRVEFFHLATDRGWTRDSCPIFVRNRTGGVALTHWRFNGWAKYENHKRDERIPAFVKQALRLKSFPAMRGNRHLVLEGGSIDVNGRGSLLTTEECLLSPIQARNPGMTREEYEEAFAQYFGVERVIWLNKGIAGDDTHGHVDDLARFVSAGTVAVVSESDRHETNYGIPIFTKSIKSIKNVKSTIYRKSSFIDMI
ncbi:MAG: agmatine deiminase family protein [Candidatus Solibacter usitatus]|nr:agmatine deiminase family protein [Candidatus Solibacter usitatus]